MALQQTQLAAAMSASQLSITVVNGNLSGLPAVGALPLPYGVPLQIDSEILYAVAQPVLGQLTLRGRGTESAAAAHDVLSNVYVGGLAGDFPLPQPGTIITTDFAEDSPISIGQDSTIVLPGANAVYNINKASAAAITVPAPSLADNGVNYEFTSNTAFAHVLTFPTGLIQDGTASAKTTATFTASKGATVNFTVENGFFNVNGTPLGVTFS
jgi:hypothetical protein